MTRYELVAGMAGIAGAAWVACVDGERLGPGSSGNPLAPPVACTEIGCQDGLTVAIRPDYGWPVGAYEFRIQADGLDVTCRGSLPLPTCLGSSDVGRSVVCDVEGPVQIVESGCALPATSQGFPGISFAPDLRPGRVEIGIARNGQLVGEATVFPSFQTVRPNGPGCPPVCDVASASIEVRF